jgi:RPA family protein
MSQNNQNQSRELAHRVFAPEFNDSTHTFRETDDEMAPVYALLPTGEKANRVFFVGTLTETNNVGDKEDYWQGRIVDPTGTVFVYAGQYQPEAEKFLREANPPIFVAVTGKPRTYETDNGEVNVSLRPEYISEVTEATRQRWITETATQTLDRIEAFDNASDPYVQMAREEYDGDLDHYRQTVITALESLDDTAIQQTQSNSKGDSNNGSETQSNSEPEGTATSSDDPESSTKADEKDSLGSFNDGN